GAIPFGVWNRSTGTGVRGRATTDRDRRTNLRQGLSRVASTHAAAADRNQMASIRERAQFGPVPPGQIDGEDIRPVASEPAGCGGGAGVYSAEQAVSQADREGVHAPL